MPFEIDSIALLICTVGDRVSELERLLHSLAADRVTRKESLVIDQNKDSRIEPLLMKFSGNLGLRSIRCAPGLSRARNVGLRNSLAPIVGFPDDDCWYFEDTLGKVMGRFNADRDLQFLCGRIVDDQGGPCLHRNWPSEARNLAMADALVFVASAALFVRRGAIESVGPFDEDMGVGAAYGSCEEVDLVRRILRAGGRGIYDPDIRIGHPNVGVSNDQPSVIRARKHGHGVGYLLAKERAGLPTVCRWVVRPLLGGLFALAKLRYYEFKRRVALGLGRFDGWRDGQRHLKCKHRGSSHVRNDR
jgi:GT2 family glycosyltransferase